MMPLRRHPWRLRLSFDPLPPRKTASCKSKPKSRSKLTEMHDRSIPRSRCCSLRPGLLASARLLNAPKASLLGSPNHSSGLQSCISVSFDREMKNGLIRKAGKPLEGAEGARDGLAIPFCAMLRLNSRSVFRLDSRFLFACDGISGGVEIPSRSSVLPHVSRDRCSCFVQMRLRSRSAGF